MDRQSFSHHTGTPNKVSSVHLAFTSNSCCQLQLTSCENLEATWLTYSFVSETRFPDFLSQFRVLADASTAFAIVSHPNHIQIFYFTAQSALYAASRGLFPDSLLPVPIPANLTFTATPVDRSLVMRALGGAITSLALTTRKAGAPHLQSLDCPPICCLIAGCYWTRQYR